MTAPISFITGVDFGHKKGILADAKRIDAYTASKGLPDASFETETLIDLPDDLEDCRKSLVNSTQELKQLAQGPVGLLLELLFTFTDLLSLEFVYHYNIPKYVPLSGDISFVEIAQQSGLPEGLVRRFIQHAVANRIFVEERAGFIKHTAATRLLKQDSEAMDTLGFLLEDLQPAATKVMAAFEKYPGSGEPNETGFNVENNTTDPFYLEIAKIPERSRRFGAGMRFMTRGSLYDINHLIQGFDWAALDKTGGIVVDIGGGQGGVSTALAFATSKLTFIVQDLPGTVKEGKQILPKELEGRVEFMAHDFMNEQPVKGADVYFFRFILHNWSDKYSIRILRNLIPAMKDGAKVVIYEFLPADIANAALSNKQPRNLDMIQALGWNSLERTAGDWQKLFSKVDPRYKFMGTRHPPRSSVALIEAVFRE